MNVQELIDKGSLTGKDRRTLYLSKSKVEGVYVDTVTEVTELVKTERIAGKAWLGLEKFLGLEIEAEGGFEQKVAMFPLLQAMCSERAAELAELLIDLTKQKPVEGPLILGPLMRYIGLAQFHVTVTKQTPDATIPQEAWDIISLRRGIQDDMSKAKNKDAYSVVLTFTKGDAVYASIASSEWLETAFKRYFDQPPFGILCLMERPAKNGVTFLDPLWIWHQTP